MASDEHAHRHLLAEYLREERGRAGGLAVLLVVSQTIPLGGPLIAKRFVDRAAAGAVVTELAWLAGLYLVIAVIAQGMAVAAIVWNGQVVDDPATLLVPPTAAYLPQVPQLFSESLADNVLLGRPDEDEALSRALWLAVLEDDVAAMPDGVSTRLNSHGVRLSGGQRQRTAAARALAARPDLVVVDDPSSALDATTEETMWSRLLDDRPASAFLIVSHRPAVIARATQVLTLEDGCVVSVS